MKVHYDLVQGTPEWHEHRFGKIGGTRLNGVFVDTDTLVNEIVAERTETYFDDDSYESLDMLRGQDLEPLAKEQLTEYTGVEFLNAGWIDSDIEGVGISPDGIDQSETIMCEIKCLKGKNHVDICLSSKVPQKHIKQVLHYFIVNPKLETMYFCSFRPESEVKPLFVKELNRQSKIDIGLTKKSFVTEDRGYGLKDYVATIPDVKTVQEWVEIGREKLIQINSKIDQAIEQLKF